jgi:hypothetical protein
MACHAGSRTSAVGLLETHPCCIQSQLDLHTVTCHKVCLASDGCTQAARGKVLSDQRRGPQGTQGGILAVPEKQKCMLQQAVMAAYLSHCSVVRH